VGLALLVLSSLPVAAQKTDVITLLNEESVTGEIKELDRGLLRYSTSYMSTIYIEWEYVLKVISDKQLETEMKSGAIFFGSFEEPSELGKLRIIGVFGETEVDIIDVVRITPIKKKFWKRWDGHLSLGFDFTKASDVARLNFDSRADYRARNYTTGIWLYSTITSQQDVETSRRQGLEGSYTHYLKNRRFAVGRAVAEQNTELGIDLRLILGGSYGYMAKQSNRSRILVSGGLQATREFKEEPATTNNLEATFRTAYEVFKYQTPKLGVNLDVAVMPSLTDWGRVRATFDCRVAWEMIKDLSWELTGYFTSDNRPPSGAQASTDYGIVTSIKWTF
jgi:hypothetical protein